MADRLLGHSRFCDRPRQAHDYRINSTALLSYIEQLQRVSGLTEGSVSAEALIGQVLSLPGVAVEPGASLPPEEEWPQIEQVLCQALERLQITAPRALYQPRILVRDRRPGVSLPAH